MNWLLQLYPARWRERYGEEFQAVLASQRASVGLVLDVLGGAIDAHPLSTNAEFKFETNQRRGHNDIPDVAMMLRRWSKTFAPRSADRFVVHDIERAGNGHSLYCVHKNISVGACGAGCGLCVFSGPVPRLQGGCILAEKALAHTRLHPSRGFLWNVPVHAGYVCDWQ
jgi:hypothetical protein